MANLLPHDVQQAIFDRMIMRVVLVASLLLALVGVIATGSILPAYMTLQTQKASLSYEIAGLTKTSSSAVASSTDSVSATNKRIRAFQTIFAQGGRLSEAVARVVADRPKGMTIERMSYDLDASTGTTTRHMLTISGTLVHGTDQNEYLRSLRSEPLFSLVEIPISALTRMDKNALTVVVHGAL